MLNILWKSTFSINEGFTDLHRSQSGTAPRIGLLRHGFPRLDVRDFYSLERMLPILVVLAKL